MPEVIVIGPDGRPQRVQQPDGGGFTTPAQAAEPFLPKRPNSIMGMLQSVGDIQKKGTDFFFGEAVPKLRDAAQNDRSLTPFEAAQFNLISDTAEAPQRIGGAVQDTIGQVSEALGEPFTPRFELDMKRQAEAQAQADAERAALEPFLRREQELQDALGASLGSLNDPSGGTGNTIDAGQVFLPGGGPELPGPPPGPNYEEVYAEVIKNMPEPPQPQDLEGQRTTALIAGLASGFLRMQDGNVGEALLGAGLGALSGVASFDEQQKAAEKEFQQRMWDYHNRVAQIKRLQAESDADFARRNWQHETNQMLRNFETSRARLKAMESRIFQTGNGFFISEIVDNGDGTGTRRLKHFNPADVTNNIAGVTKKLKAEIGEDAANTVALNMSKGHGDRAAAIWLVSKAKAEGKWSSMVDKFGVQKGLMSAGAGINALPGGTDKVKNQMVDNERDAMMIEVLMSHPAILMEAARDLNMEMPAFALRQGINPFLVGR